MNNLLSIVTFMPSIAALILAIFLRGEDRASQRNAKWVALIATSLTFLVSLFILFQFDSANTGFQMVEDRPWLGGLRYKMGVDGISVLFVMLTTFMMPITIAASWRVKRRVKEYMIAFLILETLMLGVFMSLDLILFYVFFEAGLIPMFLIIGIWGGPNRIYATFKFFLYTFLGSVMMLISMIVIYEHAQTTDIVALMNFDFSSDPIKLFGFVIPGGLQTLLFFGFFVGFAVKTPMWPVHTWLPDAHVQAPTAGSVDLAAILLKMGGYGFLRFSLPMFPVGADVMTPFVLWLSVIAIVYTSLVALVQTDMKKLIAYSSVAHMGFVTMGIFAVNQQGMDGAMFQMLSHGFISAGLFLSVGFIYDRMHTREIEAYGGLVNRMPAYALIFMFFTMANVGLPGTSGFIGEFLTMIGIFQVNTWIAMVAATGVILSAAYALYLYRRVVMGPLLKESLKTIKDLDLREKLIMGPLVAMTLFLGVYPSFVTDRVGPTIAALVEHNQTALKEAGRTEAATATAEAPAASH
ncbi:NADH-quinone oxidoreductase subunit M [Pseudooceanicola sp. CBS1P-1]|uniref:NADH-quinone oxidoreductase subunit M n=1 Tax=Pseudooceanicola albus TaxID=2692189 RepID=A0A6L7G0L8_9RHOB|nr:MULTISPECIES: NADH-quinone oxidoreductase subunit M [Pseudooceanicola]MBT9382519.1 NADH-quinone oxidoreductase subunit M [Pseudooceanicola endophyticus]MXN17060.1 NADH-quinone oxidoreductase subunit M [Pseudooceanicola albus]